MFYHIKSWLLFVSSYKNYKYRYLKEQKKKLSKIIKYTGKKFVCVQKQFIYVLKRGIIAVVVVVVVHRNAMQI